jgi:hypothetical protein
VSDLQPVPGRHPRSLRPPGYLACNRVIERLRRFQDLVRHDQRWAHQIEQARPLGQLIPPNLPEHQKHLAIEKELNRIIPLVARDMDRAGISTGITWTTKEEEYDFEKSVPRFFDKKHTADLVSGYFELPKGSRMRGQTFDMLLRSVDQAIGVYEHLRTYAIHRKFNPLHWAAFVLSIPVQVLELAGLDGAEVPSKLVTAYGWALRIVFLGAAALAATYFGIKIPWNAMLQIFKLN